MEKRNWKTAVFNIDGSNETKDSGHNCGCGNKHGSDCECGNGGREGQGRELQLSSVYAEPFYIGSYLKHRR